MLRMEKMRGNVSESEIQRVDERERERERVRQRVTERQTEALTRG